MIVPSSANALLLAANAGDPLDEFGKIARSERFRASALPALTKVLPLGDRSKWTLDFSYKRSGTSAETIFGVGVDDNNYTRLAFAATGELVFESYNGGATSFYKKTAQLFRDFAAHSNFRIEYDPANATAEDRIKIVVDGDRITSFASSTNPALNYATGYVCSANQHCFSQIPALSGAAYLNGYLSFAALISGQIVSNLWARHPRTGQWRPKSKAAIRAAVAAGGGTRNGWGASGFFLPFDDATSTTTLGYDRSQSDTDTTGNNFTATNISVTAGVTYDSMLDTPTANYCGLSAVANGQSTLSDGGLTIAGAASATGAIHGTMIVPRNFPVYWEVENASLTASLVAISAGVCRSGIKVSENYETNAVAGVAGFYNSNSRYLMKDDGSRPSLGSLTLAASVVVQVAIDGDNGWIGLNDVWFDGAGGTTGNPQTGANPTFTISSAYDYVPFIHVYSNTARANFGQRPWTRTCPAGFKTVNTKNLPIKPAGPMKSTSAFAAVADTGANIQATLAAARPGWTDYIEIFKSFGVEGWRWRFSDDIGNYLDSSSTAAKAAFPALAGASYIGYGLKVSAANGIATGRLTHTSGVADVVSDGLSNTRKAIILKNEATGNWFFYHPDLTAGKLLYINLTAHRPKSGSHVVPEQR